MDKKTREQFTNYQTNVAELNAVSSTSESFNIEPDISVVIEKEIQESSAFLNSINSIAVINQQGSTIGIGATGSIAGRTNTNNEDRGTQDPTGFDEGRYFCTQTNFDTHLSYAKMDAWRHHPDFAGKYGEVITDQIGRDRMKIGFNGVKVSPQTDRVKFKLLEDVNVGWLEKIRQYKKTAEGSPQFVKATLGKDYQGLDGAVFDAKNNIIGEEFRTDTDLVVIMGSDLWTDKYLTMIEQSFDSMNKSATDLLIGKGLIGGLRPVQVPFFPADCFLITSLANLSIYWQENSRRRFIVDNPKRDRVEDYQSVNEDYIVENFEKTALVEIKKGGGDEPIQRPH